MRYEQQFLERLKSIFTINYLDGLEAKVDALRELQSQTQEELDALSSSPCGISSVLERAFKGEL